MARRVVLVVLNFPVPEDRRVWLQATAARDAGHDVTVVCPALREHQPGDRVVEGVQVRYFPAFEGAGPVGVLAEAALGALRAGRAVRSLGLAAGDLLQVCTPPDTLWPLLRWARRHGIATVYDQHDVVPLLAATKPSQRPLVPIHSRFERLTVGAASTVITAGEAQARRLRRLYGADPVVVRTAADDTPRRHHPRPRATTFGYLGVMGSQDGVDRLITAFSLLLGRGSAGIRLRLAGDGPEAPRLRDLIDRLHCQEQVEMCGWLDTEALEDFLGTVDALVVPDPLTAFNHTCPMLKVSHALAHGLPLVMTGLEENLAITGGTAFLSRGDSPEQLADAMAAFTEAPLDQRLREGQRLRDRFEQVLRWDSHRTAYLSVLHRTPG